MDAWKWWFGGIIFFAVTFCVAKCMLGRGIFYRGRPPPEQQGVDMQPVYAFEVSTHK
jgi:hypothetical protein